MDKIEVAEKEIETVLKKHSLKLGYKFNFPKYRILPDSVKLAMNVLHEHGMKVIVIIKEKEDK